MKLLSTSVVGLLLFAIQASGQTYLTPQDGSLVDCGKEKVVVAEGTESPDGRFAAGWTIRPKDDQKPPVDWSGHQREDPLKIINKYAVNSNPTGEGEKEDDPDKSDYLLVNGVLNLQAKTFTPLPTQDPYFPYKTHGSLRAVWSEDRHGNRYGALGNSVGSNHTEDTVDLWLVTVDASGVRSTNLKPGADKAVAGFLCKKHKSPEHYVWSFDFDDMDAKASTPRTQFKGNFLTLHFEAENESDPDGRSGYVKFSLPKGTVSEVTPGKSP